MTTNARWVLRCLFAASVILGCAGPRKGGGLRSPAAGPVLVTIRPGLKREPKPAPLVIAEASAPLASRSKADITAAQDKADKAAKTIAQMATELSCVVFRLQDDDFQFGIKTRVAAEPGLANRKVFDDHVESYALATRAKGVQAQMAQLPLVEVVATIPSPTPDYLDQAIRTGLKKAVLAFAADQAAGPRSSVLRGELTIVTYQFNATWGPTTILMRVNVRLNQPKSRRARSKPRRKRPLPKDLPPALRRALEQ